MNLSVILRLAERVERKWLQCGTRDDAFPEVAAQALATPIELDFAAVARAIFSTVALPAQRRLDEGFGQPAVTLFHSENFDIEALCWREGTPAIHEHGFSGAFRLMEGASVQARFRFAADRRLGQLELGRLERIGFERLVPGMVIPIRAGHDMIHSNFHLLDPGLTLVVRTHQHNVCERTFLPPGVAYDSAARPPVLHKRLQMLDTLNATGSADYASAVGQAIARGEPYEILAVLLRAGAHASAQPHFAGFLAQLREQFGAKDGSLLAEAVAVERRRSMLVRMRREARDGDTRLAVACLLDCRDRADFDALLAAAAAVGSEPPDAVSLLTRLLQPDERQRPLTAAAVVALLEDASPHVFVAAMAARAETPFCAERAVGLERYYRMLRDHPWLEPLLARPSVPL